MHRASRLPLLGLLAALSLGAVVPAALAVSAGGTMRPAAAMLVRQRAEVRRLQKNVSAQESASREAAAKLARQDAQIAELQRQLQAARRAGNAVGEGP